MSSRCLNLVLAAAALALCSCKREKTELRPGPAQLAIFGDAARESTLEPGGGHAQPPVANPNYGEAYSISEGQRLFSWYNCTGCHANGGGAIGPPLIKSGWTYGGDPANLFDTIVKGRPNGMPAWGGKIPEYQIWQLVAYIRSLNGEQPKSATPERQDHIEFNPETSTKLPGGAAK